MSINNVINQSQIAFNATLSANTAAVTGDGTAYTLICDTVNFNNGLAYNHTTGIFTAPKSGNYLFSYNVNYLANSGGAQTFETFLSCNSLNYAYQAWPTNNECPGFQGPNGWTSAFSFIILPMAVGQTASIIVKGSGGLLNDIVAGSLVSNPTSFYGLLIN